MSFVEHDGATIWYDVQGEGSRSPLSAATAWLPTSSTSRCPP